MLPTKAPRLIEEGRRIRAGGGYRRATSGKLDAPAPVVMIRRRASHTC
ncbi:MAG TPA: hypothetical protein VEN79_15120 [Terriglobia bacterium]|nr:hypothetical protein [Terriglobia bacterium]